MGAGDGEALLEGIASNEEALLRFVGKQWFSPLLSRVVVRISIAQVRTVIRRRQVPEALPASELLVRFRFEYRTVSDVSTSEGIKKAERLGS